MKALINKRSFPRRKLDLVFDLIINGEAVPAVATDYSFNGMGILIKGKSELNVQMLDLKLKDINLNSAARIIWKREVFAGLKVGVVIMGPLEAMQNLYQMSDFLLGIQRSRKTGVLRIGTGQELKEICFKNGEIVLLSSGLEQDELGPMLIGSGRISPGQYQKAFSLAEAKGKSLDAVLVDMNYVKQQELIRTANQKIESAVMNLCNPGSAKYSFEEEALPSGGIVMLRLNVNDILYRSSRNTDCIAAFKNRYLDKKTEVSLSSETRTILDHLALEPQDREILSLIIGRTSIGEILSVSPLNEEDTLRSLYALFSARLLEMETSNPEENNPQEKKPAQEEKVFAPELAERIERLYLEHKTLGYHGVLGLQPKATVADIKYAYHAMAKEYHPDRYFLYIQDEALREKLNVIFAYINEAYRELSKAGGISQQKPQTSSAEQKSPGIDIKTMAQGKYRQGLEYLRNQNFDDAMTLLGQAVYLDDAVPDYHYYYGIALLRNKKMREAEAEIRKALGLSPDNADYFAGLGHIYLQLGFMARAKNAFDKAIRINPYQAEASQGINKILQMKKD